MKIGMLLAIGMVLLGGAMGMNYIERPDMSETAVCTACKSGLKELHEAASAEVLEKAGDEVIKEACGKIWFIPHKTCEKYGGKLVKPIVKVIDSYLEGGKLCKLMKACEEETTPYTVDDFDLTNEDTACVKCQLLVNKGKSVVSYKKELLKSVLLEIMDKCSDEELEIPEDVCTDFMNGFGVDVIETLIAGIPEYETCSALGKCE